MAELSAYAVPFALRPAVIILALIAVLTLGCSKGNPEIVGIWDNVKVPEVVEFKPDGTGVFTYSDSRNPPLTFTWKQVIKNSYILEINFLGSRKDLTAAIHSSTLSIQSTTGEELYQRHTSR